MTAPTINGTRYPQPVDALLPKARQLAVDLGEVPSRNRLMREFRIGAPTADEIRTILIRETAKSIVHRELTGQQMLREVVARAEVTGAVLTGEQITDEYGTDASMADLISNLAAVAVRRRAEGLPTNLGDEQYAGPVYDYEAPIGPVPAPVEPDRTPGSEPVPAPDPTPAPAVPDVEPTPEVGTVGHPGTPAAPTPRRPVAVWPVILLALPAFVAVWSGWVGLGRLTGFGIVDLLPGIVDPGGWATIDSAITLPIGVETYAAYALYVWLSGRVPERARKFAKWSAIVSLLVGAGGQIAYHLLAAAGVTAAPWQITTAVACLPVAVLGMGAALAHLVREDS
jgi:hypothetical protein